MKKIGKALTNQALLSVKGGGPPIEVICFCNQGGWQWEAVYNNYQLMWDDVVLNCGYVPFTSDPDGYCEPNDN
ncbi:hypothetical protein [uncultured Roseivirga sp.]|uniref:hypothetical protein n=1 Tax=uncultured Roseivirga sp. TaxID=543088 RepID=UPI0030D80D5D|tara:strand:- start:289 stop:507 length:219 start_codon:yes stop_codon:yes gene_type:complete